MVLAGARPGGWSWPFGEEGQLGAFFTAAQQPDQQPVGGVVTPVRRDHQTVGLDGIVEFRAIAAQNEPGGLQPWRLAATQMGITFAALAEQVVGDRDFPLGKELVVAEGPVDGLVEDFDVRQESGEVGSEGEFASEVVDRLPQGVGAGGECSSLAGWNRDAGGGGTGRGTPAAATSSGAERTNMAKRIRRTMSGIMGVCSCWDGREPNAVDLQPNPDPAQEPPGSRGGVSDLARWRGASPSSHKICTEPFGCGSAAMRPCHPRAGAG